jgi:hypothetical protein
MNVCNKKYQNKQKKVASCHQNLKRTCRYIQTIYIISLLQRKKNQETLADRYPTLPPSRSQLLHSIGPNAKFEAFLIIYFQARDYVQLPTEYHMQLSTHSLTPDTNVELLAFFHTLYYKINKKSHEKQMSLLIIWLDCLSFFQTRNLLLGSLGLFCFS